MNLYKIVLDKEKYLTLSKPLIKEIGDRQTIILMELVTYENYLIKNNKIKEGDMFYIKYEQIINEFGYSRSTISTIMKSLQKMELIDIVRKGVPAKNYYLINQDNLCELLNYVFEKDKEESIEKKQELDVLKSNNKMCENYTSRNVKSTQLFNKRTTNNRITNNINLSKDKLEGTPSSSSSYKSLINKVEYKLIEKYNPLLDVKLTLPNSKNNKVTKELKNAIKKITSLLNGTYLNNYHYEKATLEMTKPINHPLTYLELDELIGESIKKYRLIHKGNYFPTDKSVLKMNLNQFLYNEYTGMSWFMHCLTDIKPSKVETTSGMRCKLNTSILWRYEHLFKYKLTEDEDYRMLYNITENLKYINSYLKKVENIYRWNNNFINNFSSDIAFCATHAEFLKTFGDDLAPGHLKLTGKVGEQFKKWCKKKYDVAIAPTVEDLEYIQKREDYDRRWDERQRKNRELQKEKEKELTEADIREFEYLASIGEGV